MKIKQQTSEGQLEKWQQQKQSYANLTTSKYLLSLKY